MIDGVNLLAIRHFRTIWGLLRIIQGQLDSPLINSGENQAIEIAKKIGDKISLGVIVSSDLGRAVQTAKIISLILNKPFTEKLYYFRERNLGVIQGQSKKSLHIHLPDIFDRKGRVIDDINKVKYIESEEEFIYRIKLGLSYLRMRYGKRPVILITHGGVIRFLYAYRSGFDLSSLYAQIPVNNGEVVEF